VRFEQGENGRMGNFSREKGMAAGDFGGNVKEWGGELNSIQLIQFICCYLAVKVRRQLDAIVYYRIYVLICQGAIFSHRGDFTAEGNLPQRSQRARRRAFFRAEFIAEVAGSAENIILGRDFTAERDGRWHAS
jgi:hypothetical protein